MLSLGIKYSMRDLIWGIESPFLTYKATVWVITCN